jgi:lipopolysaccharide/colanic/teichoic acid biosynthesis glycosyltransferase/glycosyltransferase involved in cell wall biosynthesis
MRVLMLTQWFDPEPTFKGQLFAQELRRLGHHVEVITGFPNYPGGRLYPGYRVRAYQRDVVDGIVVHRVPLYPSHDASAGKRVLNYGSFALSATVKILSGRRPDVVYVYHPPGTVALPAMVARLVRGVPFVYDVQDLWPDTLAATGMLSDSRILGAVARVMDATYGLAAHVVVLSDGFRRRLTERGVPAAKVSVIRNWASEHEIEHSEPGAARTALGLADSFNVVFAGAMGPAQALDAVLDAASLLGASPVRFVLIGSGMDRERLERRASELGLRNVVFLPRRPQSEIGQVLAAADALLVHLKDDPLFEITIPSKTQAYLLAGKPILMGVRGDAATLVREAAAGMTFEPGDPAALASAVQGLRDMSDDERRALGANGRRFYERHLALGVGASRFASLLELAAQSRSRWERAKRAGDLAVSGAALTVLAVPMAAIAAVVRTRVGRPVIFRQTRPGRHGEPFTILKFRTMTDARGTDGELLPDTERLTPVGRFLRTTSLDELPELVNVLRGEMSIVGPRPLLERYTPYYTPRERRRLDVRPGITGLAQVSGRNEASWTSRLERDATYVESMSPLLDLKIIALTVVNVLRRSGAVSDPASAMEDLDIERRPSDAVGATR